MNWPWPANKNLAAAYDRGFFNDLITPFNGLSKDNNLRADSSMEKLGKLKPAFGKNLGEAATMTAGNSTPLTDGASAVLLGSEEYAQANDLPMLANFVDFEAAAVDFVHGEEGLLMAPAYATARMLKRNNLTLQDFDFYRDPRSLRRHRAVHAQGMGRRRILPREAWLGCPAGRHRPVEAERQRLLALGSRTPICRHRRPHYRQHRKECCMKRARAAH